MKKIFKNSVDVTLTSLKMLKTGLIASILILAFSTVLVSANGDDKDKNQDVLAFTSLLNGGQEVPETNSNAFGVVFMTLEQDVGILSYSITYTDDKLVGTETATHFHAPANPDETAPVVFTVSPDVSPLGSPKNGSVGPLTKKQINDLKKGLFYLNIHSSAFPDGEIRGQVIPVSKVRYSDDDNSNDNSNDNDNSNGNDNDNDNDNDNTNNNSNGNYNAE